jgi:hypothetical protein
LEGTAVSEPARPGNPEDASTPKYAASEVDGVFFDREHLEQALAALVAAGFGYPTMMATLERRVDGGRRVAVTELPERGGTPVDKQQTRTLATSLAGTVGAFAALGVTIATGGTALAAVAAAAMIGGSAATGVHVFKAFKQSDGVVPEQDVILSVRITKPSDVEVVADIFQRHGAQEIWALNPPG